MFIPKLLVSLLILRLGVPVVYLIVKFSPLVIQCIVKIVTQEEEGFYLLFLSFSLSANSVSFSPGLAPDPGFRP